ncbi:phage tail fiber protein [Serratia fonticola]
MENGAFGVGGATKILSSSDTLAIIQSLKTGKYAVNAGSVDMPVKDLAYCLDWTLTSPTSGGHGVLIATGLITAPSSWDRVYRNTLRNGMWQGWVVLYDTENKPTARDVDAVSASQGGEFKKEIQASGGVMVANAWQGKPGGIFPGNGDGRTFELCNVDIKSWYGVGFYNTCTGAGIQGRTIIMNVREGYLEAKGNIRGLGLYDTSGRVYSPGNKPTAADVGALTDAQAMQKYALRAYKVNGKPLTGDVNLLAADVNAWNKTEADTRYLMLTGGQVKGKTGFLGGLHLGNENTCLEAGGDAAGFTTNNLLLKSWYGIGFVNTCTTSGIQGVAGFVNVRNGDLQMKRNITADAQIIEAGKRVYSPNNKPTAADVDAWNKTEADGRYLMKNGGQLTGVVKTSAEIQSTTSDNYRLIGGDYGTYWRNDGNSLYLLMTNAKNQYGAYNELRPLAVNVKNGDVVLGHNAVINGNLRVGQATHSTDGNIMGSRWGNKWLWDAVIEQVNGRVDWNSFNNRTHVAGDRNAWWYRDELTGFIIQGGVVNRVDYVNWVGFPRGYARECFGVQLTLTSSNGTWFGDSRVNIQARDLGNNGFNAMMDGQEQVVFWQSVGV